MRWSVAGVMVALAAMTVDARAWRPTAECNGRAKRWEDGPAFFRLHPVWGDPASDWGGRSYARWWRGTTWRGRTR